MKIQEWSCRKDTGKDMKPTPFNREKTYYPRVFVKEKEKV